VRPTIVERTPDGFVTFSVGRADVVCAPHVADAVRSVLSTGTLYRYAASHASVRPMAGRGVAYAASLPDDIERIVVRHNRHGGLLAAVTRDLFLRPTRAPHELRTSERLRAAGVPTPVMLGYVVYGAVAGFVRVDVFSRQVPDSFDLSAVLVDPKPAEVVQAWSATCRLVRALAEAGARHHDLNVKNILLQHIPGRGFEALALDVDRVEFSADRDAVNEANITRLLRSARKWQQERGARIADADLRDLEALLRRSVGQREPSTRS
jgi:3-deoxy-D-manno-octulosonic acid kinase